MHKKNLLVVIIAMAAIIVFLEVKKRNHLPVIAIANYGPHASLEASIRGIKAQLAEDGFIENKTIRYIVTDVGFDHTLIPQMITNLRQYRPKVMIVMATPVAQWAKGKIHDIPLVYNVITDPVEAGLIKNENQAEGHMTGSSDRQDLNTLLTFAKLMLPDAKTIGILYATSDSNDTALVRMMRSAADIFGMSVLAVPVDQVRDIPIRMQALKGKVDFIYVGTSGPIQPALPTIASEAQKMGLPVFNVEEQAVRDGLALASFGVNYVSVGKNAGKLVVQLLRGADIKTLSPLYPTSRDHQCFINKAQAKKFGIEIPTYATVVE